ncbi:MAG: hypothetical protein H6679_01465 [Epsilonproteobacteria bacterium]|nr:hypothetical protein [Campylobacterota bacterium]
MATNTLSACWKASLSFFKPSEFKVLLWATGRNLNTSIKLMLRYFWWLLAAIVIIPFCIVKLGGDWQALQSIDLYTEPTILMVCGALLLTLSTFLLTFFYVLCARPSNELKNASYFITYTPYMGLVALLWVVMGIMGHIPLLRFAAQMASLAGFLGTIFFLDGKNTLKDFGTALLNGLQMLIYFAPFFALLNIVGILVVMALLGLVFMLLFWLEMYLFGTGTISFSIVAMFLFLFYAAAMSFYMVMYTKIKHSYHTLFFQDKQTV